MRDPIQSVDDFREELAEFYRDSFLFTEQLLQSYRLALRLLLQARPNRLPLDRDEIAILNLAGHLAILRVPLADATALSPRDLTEDVVSDVLLAKPLIDI